jgi:hypothetical protein
MKSFQTNKQQQQEALKKNSLLLLQLEKQKQQQQQSSLQQRQPPQPLFQDTNYIGITINDDLPKQTYNNDNNTINISSSCSSSSSSGGGDGLTRHQSLSHSTSKTNNALARHASFSYTTNNNNNTNYHSPRLQQQQSSFSPRFSQAPLIEEPHEDTNYCVQVRQKEEEDDYMIQSDKSGAFRKIKSQADLPMSHHRRAREGKRYGVSKNFFRCYFRYLIYSY